ncbi:unnamed protein product [Alopecurus aequalis]
MAPSPSPLLPPPVLPTTIAPPQPLAPCPLLDPDSGQPAAAAIGGDEAPVSLPLGCTALLLPPPPAQLPPNFTPELVADASVGSMERAWEEVGGRRRHKQEKAPAPPPRKETGPSLAFKRRTYGLCFRCLAPEHFVADCHGPVRCLSCRRPGHRERDCTMRQSAGRDPRRRRSPSPPAAPGRPSSRVRHDCNTPRSCSRSPPVTPLQPRRSWAAVVVPPDAHSLEVPQPGAPAAEPAVDLGLLQPLLVAQAERLSAELQSMFASRLEEVFRPLRDLVAAVQGWTDQVSSLLELMETAGGSFVLDNPSLPCELDASAPLAMVDGKVSSVSHCSTEVFDVVALGLDDPLALDSVLPETVTQGVEEQVKVDEIVASCNDVELIERALPFSAVGEVPPKGVSEFNNSFGGDGVPPGPTSSTLLDEFLGSFGCAGPLSLLDAPILVQTEGGASCVGRRSGRLDKKNKDSNIPAAKRAEYRLAESFGELPRDSFSKRGTEEDVQERMKPYLQMCKKPITPTTLQAVRELVEANV